MTWKRYQVHPSAESADSSSAVRSKTKVLSAHVNREIAIQLIHLFDGWSKAVRYQPDAAHSAQKTRDQISSGATGIKLGFSVPPEHWIILEGTPENDYKDGLIAIYKRKKNWIATWCLENAIDEITVAKLRLEYPQIKPSLSLVALLVFKVGLDRLRRELLPALPDPKTVKDKWSLKRRAELSARLCNRANRLKGKDVALQKKSLLEMAKLVETATSEVLDQLSGTIQCQLDA